MATSKDILASIALRLSINAEQFGKDITKIKGNFDVLKVGLKELGKLFAGAFAVSSIAAFGKAGFEAYQKQYKAEQLLLSALRGRKDIQERLITQAEYLRKTTLFEDEEIITQQKMLAALGLSEKQIRSVISASTELATALGTDLDSAVKMLLGSYSGNLRQLSRLIPELKNFTKEQLASGAAIDWVNQNMKGLAETAANTDPVTQMSKAWGEFGELIGKVVAPAITGLLKELNNVLERFMNKDIPFWQKLLALVPGAVGDNARMVIDAMAQGAADYRQEQDNLTASTEKFTSSVDNETEALKRLKAEQDKIKKNLEDMSKSVKGTLFETPSQFGQNNLTPIQSSSAGLMPTQTGQPGFNDFYKRGYDNLEAFAAKEEEVARRNEIFVSEMNMGFASIAAGFGQALGQMIATGDKLDFSFLLDGFATMLMRLGELAIAAGVATLGIKAALESMNGYAAIAAGVALVAIASAVKSGMSSMASGMGGGGYSSGQYSTASASGSDYMNRQLGEGYTNVQVELVLRNDHLAVANARGQRQNARW